VNFWQRYVGDVQRKTSHLSCAEMGAYDRLLDHIYATEQQLPGDLESCCRIARAMDKGERAAVASVLRQFFEVRDGQHVNPRASEEIEKAQPKIAAAKTNGALGGRPRGTQRKPTGLLVGLSAGTQEEPSSKALQNQIPEGIPSEANASGAKAPPPSSADEIFGRGLPALIAAGCPEKNARSMLGLMRKTHGDDALIQALATMAKERPLEPVAWLQAALKPKTKGSSSHAGFALKNYRDGVTEDGSIAV
jgi:uncharacterized protein YdaU (DUF1376 family)